jgi:hypothetical protein
MGQRHERQGAYGKQHTVTASVPVALPVGTPPPGAQLPPDGPESTVNLIEPVVGWDTQVAPSWGTVAVLVAQAPSLNRVVVPVQLIPPGALQKHDVQPRVSSSVS